MKRGLFLLFILFYLLDIQAQSIFEKEGLLKIATVKEGIYQLDKQFFEAAGIDLATLNPRKIQVYGMAGGMVPQKNTVSYPESPEAISMQLIADNDQQFEADEKLLFYADNIDHVSYDFDENKYTYEKNYYADTLYYFVDINSSIPQKLVGQSQKQPGSTSLLIDYYDYISVHEAENSNILNSGRKWFGESFFVEKEREFSFDLPNDIQSGHSIAIETQYLGQSYSNDSLRIYVNNFLMAFQSLPAISPFEYAEKGYLANNFSQFNTSLLSENKTITIKLSHLPSGNLRSEGKLDYLFLATPLKLSFGANQMVMRNRDFQNGQAFSVDFQNAKPQWILDVSNPLSPELIQPTADNQFHYTPSLGAEVKFVAYNLEQAFRPIYTKRLPSFKLSPAMVPDFLIVSHSDFMNAAQELASHRRGMDGYDVKVVDQSQVFDQYGAGRRDVSALRNYIRAQYRLNPQKLKYVLLMGSGSYDYKERLKDNSNYIPIYQSRNSTSPTATYASDDFFTLMDSQEGEWIENNFDYSDMDLGIGRIPCRSANDALHIVRKIIRYDTDPVLKGKWRNELYFVADDEEDVNSDTNSFYKQSDQLADSLTKNYGSVSSNKLYIGSYEQEVFASYERSPAMQEALSKMMRKGALIVNYIGHGAYNSWTDEAILTNNLISSWKNENHFPLFVTATCEFGRHDSPSLISGAQVLLHQKNSGAIGLLTTSRPVFSNTNFALNKAFYQSAFERTSSGAGKKLGDIIRDTKNNSISGVKNRNFILLGDPSLTLGLPKAQIMVSSIEGLASGADTISAQDLVQIEGFIANNSQAVQTNFNGTVIAELFDKESKKKTLVEGNDQYTYQVSDNILYRGQATVRNGVFDLSFYVPREMDYQLGKGQLKLYAYGNSTMQDAGGFNNNILVGGSIESAIDDNTGPSIALYLNDSTFIDGDEVGSKNDLLVKLSDEYGISISTSKLNSGIYYQLDGGLKEPLSDYFYYDVDSYQAGKAIVALPSLSEGQHNLTVFARDVFNNLNQSQIDFYVISNATVTILEYLLYPNPATDNAIVQFTHNRKEEEIIVDLMVFDHLGRAVFNNSYETDEYKNKIIWDLQANNGEKIEAGMYFMNLMVRSKADGSKSQEIKKLIIIN